MCVSVDIVLVVVAVVVGGGGGVFVFVVFAVVAWPIGQSLTFLPGCLIARKLCASVDVVVIVVVVVAVVGGGGSVAAVVVFAVVAWPIGQSLNFCMTASLFGNCPPVDVVVVTIVVVVVVVVLWCCLVHRSVY